MEASLKEQRWTTWFWLFALGHVTVWTLVPALTQPNGPLDTMEMLYWGHEWQWGYYKHPPLPAWLAQSASVLSGNAIWPTYLLSQLCILACLWAAWQLLRGQVAPWIALGAVALIEASAYYNYTTPELNNNMLRRATTALSVLFIYWAISRRQIVYWFAGGLFLGLGLLSKYDHGLWIISILGFAMINRQTRPLWRTLGPYVLMAVTIVVFLPHAWWMVRHDYITLGYVQNRLASDIGWLTHVVHPLKFAAAQWASIGLMLLFLTPLLGWRWKLRKNLSDKNRLLRDYLAFVILGPFLITITLSCVTGAYVRSMLGAPMWMFFPALALLTFERRREDPRTYQRLTMACATLSLVFAIALGTRNLFGTTIRQKPLRTDYPGQQLAAQVSERWNQHARGPIPLVGGDWWPAANVGFYLPRRTSVYPELVPEFAPWTSDSQLNQTGGVILWEIRKPSDRKNPAWLSRFPGAINQEPIVIVHRKAPDIPPLQVGLAIVPPAINDPATRSAATTHPLKDKLRR